MAREVELGVVTPDELEALASTRTRLRNYIRAQPNRRAVEWVLEAETHLAHSSPATVVLRPKRLEPPCGGGKSARHLNSAKIVWLAHRRMLRTLSIVISIALADSVNVSTIGPALVLAAGEHPRRSVFEFSIGVIVVFSLGGALLVLGPGRALLALVPHPSPTARYIVETVVGVIMLVGGAVLWTRRRSSTRHPDEGRKRREVGAQSGDHGAQAQRRKSPALMGAGIALAELPTAFPYFAAIAAIVSARLSLWRELLLVAVYDVCFVLPLFGIIVVLTVGGERATQTLARIRTQFEAHWRALAAGAALVAGVYVTVLGVTGLASGAPGPVGRVSRKVRHGITR